jgi:hypothetical protein
MRTCTLVWIDAREAVIVGWHGDSAQIERVGSDVPAHRRSTGHVRHDPATRHGGGGSPQSAGEPHRLEHLERFVDLVAARLPPDDDLIVLGPGTVREHLERHVREIDDRQGRVRDISAEPSPRRTERQLVARLRHVLDADPPRRTVGAYRWTKPPVDDTPGLLPAPANGPKGTGSAG